MYTIKTLNQISQAGLSKLPEAEFLIDPEAARPEGIILRASTCTAGAQRQFAGVARAGAAPTTPLTNAQKWGFQYSIPPVPMPMP